MARFHRILNSNADASKFVCVGLDPDVDRPAGMFPSHLLSEPDVVRRAYALCEQIVVGVGSCAAAYKPNFGFFARHGGRGVDMLAALVRRIRTLAPDSLVILDMKAGDIANTAKQYAVTAFETLGADAVTVSPYMGDDAIIPFAEYADGNKGVFVLCRTSNPSAARYQDALQVDGEPLYIHVARDMAVLNERFGNIGVVVGATQKDPVVRVREVVPDLPLLIPGFGKQGGLISDIVPSARPNGRGPILVNHSSEYGNAWKTDPSHSVSVAAYVKYQEIDAQIRAALGIR